MHLVCTGSLTNAALLLTLFPEVAGSLVDITIMGGCLGPGNTHPVAEFNFQARLSRVHQSLHLASLTRHLPLLFTEHESQH